MSDITGGEDQNSQPVDINIQLEKAQSEAQDYKKLLQRVQADFIYYKKRTEKEQTEQRKLAVAEFIVRLLPVLDDFELAMKAILRNTKSSKVNEWINGMSHINRKLNSTLEEEGLKAVEAEGKIFNPMEHEAAMVEYSDYEKEDSILNVLQTGYWFNDCLLRPAKVVVAKADKYRKG